MKIQVILIFLVCISLQGCISRETAKLESYVNPGYRSNTIKSVAILPITNSRLSASNSAEISSSFAKEISRRNASLRVLSGSDTISILNEANKADIWAEFLRNYSVGGIQNTRVIKEIATLLNVDGMIQGSIVDVKQEDSNGFNYPMTRVVIRYTMFSASDGSILWEVTGDGAIQPYSYTAAPIFEALRLANDKVMLNLPL